MEVSVIMPVFNAELYLSEAIESILSQTYGDFEFIIIDDGSTDGTVDIIRHYEALDPRIRYIRQAHGGIVGALNRGLTAARGAWAFRMDADDFALPPRLALQVAMINRDPSLILLGGWYDAVDAAGKFLKRYKVPDNPRTLVRNLENARMFLSINHPTAGFRKDIVLGLGGYRERFRHAEDIDLWLRMVGKGRFGCCQKVVLKLRKHGENISNKKSLIQPVISTAARICYFRKKLGYHDLSQIDEEDWDKFIKWIKKELDNLYFFRNREFLASLGNSWHGNSHDSKLWKTLQLAKEVLNQPDFARVLWQRYIQNENISYKLALKSLALF